MALWVQNPSSTSGLLGLDWWAVTCPISHAKPEAWLLASLAAQVTDHLPVVPDRTAIAIGKAPDGEAVQHHDDSAVAFARRVATKWVQEDFEVISVRSAVNKALKLTPENYVNPFSLLHGLMDFVKLGIYGLLDWRSEREASQNQQAYQKNHACWFNMLLKTLGELVVWVIKLPGRLLSLPGKLLAASVNVLQHWNTRDENDHAVVSGWKKVGAVAAMVLIVGAIVALGVLSGGALPIIAGVAKALAWVFTAGKVAVATKAATIASKTCLLFSAIWSGVKLLFAGARAVFGGAALSNTAVKVARTPEAVTAFKAAQHENHVVDTSPVSSVDR